MKLGNEVGCSFQPAVAKLELVGGGGTWGNWY